MPQINQLSALSQVSSGDQIPVYAPANGDARRMSVSQLLQYFQQTFASPTMATNIYTPTTGFNIAVPSPASEQQWILLRPAGTLASGTITLPLNTTALDGSEVLISTTQQITAFSISLNGAAAASGVPSRLNAGNSICLRYVQSLNSWYNITDSTFNPDIGVASGTSLTLTGAMQAGGAVSGTTGTFSGAVSGTTGTFSSAVSGTTGTFSGAVSGTTGTFSSAVSGTTGTFSGAVSGTTGTFSGAVSGASGSFAGGALSSATLSTTGNATIGGSLSSTGNIASDASILANSTTSRVGYGTAAGGAQTQTTSKGTDVTLDTPTGQITMNNANLNAGASVSFNLNSTTIQSRDLIILNYISGAADPFAYTLIGQCQAGKAFITLKNISAGNLGEAIVFRFAIIAGDIVA